MKSWLKISLILWGITFTSSPSLEETREESSTEVRWLAQKITQTCDVQEPSQG